MAAEDMSMADVDSSTQWLVERARQSLKENNPYEAKAWLITAKTLYPKDFGVQVRLQCLQVYLPGFTKCSTLDVILLSNFQSFLLILVLTTTMFSLMSS